MTGSVGCRRNEVCLERERGLHSVVIVIHTPRRTHHGYFRNPIIHKLTVPSTQTSTYRRDFLSPSDSKKKKKETRTFCLNSTQQGAVPKAERKAV